MIVKSTTQSGRGLATHLLNESDNERVSVLGVRDFVDGDLAANIEECQLETAGTSALTGVIHASLSPAEGMEMSDADWEKAWAVFEREFDLERKARAGVEHTKHGRTHRHHIYQRIGAEGRAVDMSFNRVRNEKVARVIEFELGHPLVKGRHNRAVMRALVADGRADVARAMRDASLDNGPRPVAVKDHNEHQQGRRTGITKEEVANAVVTAWRTSDSHGALETAFADAGLALAMGEKTSQVVDAAGRTHDLRRTLRAGGESVKAAAIRQRIDETTLPGVADVRAA